MEKINKKGVTLIELVIVMVIIAIGALLMTPNFGRWVSYYRLRTATRDIVSTMRVAQMKAISNNTAYRVSFTTGTTSSYVVERNTGTSWEVDGASLPCPSGISIATTSSLGDPPRAVFNPDSTSSSGSITVSNHAGATKRIVLYSATGRIKIED